MYVPVPSIGAILCVEMGDLGLVAWITILAFLLAIPMAVAANILTPKVQKWWAKTSAARRHRRIVFLEKELFSLEEALEPDARHEQFVRGLRLASVAGMLVSYLLGMAFAGIVMIASTARGVDLFPEIRETGLMSTERALTIILGIGFLCWYGSYVALYHTLQLLRRASRTYLESQLLAVRRELDRLRDRA